MEDRYAYLEGEQGILVAMVCDGHGGYQAAAETVNALPRLLIDALKRPAGSNARQAEVIRNVIVNFATRIKSYHSGSTLTGIAVKNGILYIYNIGDSRTCCKLQPSSNVYMLKPIFSATDGAFIDRIIVDYVRQSFFCTADHDPDSATEVKRVETAGGKIANHRLNGILSVTRSIGDSDVGPGIDYTPDVYWVNIRLLVGPVVMFSDGIYEPQRSKPAMNFDNQYLYNLGASSAEDLVDYAYKNGSDDNLTALTVKV